MGSLSINQKLNNIRCMEDLMAYVSDPSNYKRTQKKHYSVYICLPKEGSKVHNVLEKSDYVTDGKKPFVISGTRGETWVIDAGKLCKTYQFPDGSPITPERLRAKAEYINGVPYIDWVRLDTQPGGGGTNWAIFVPKQFQVPVSTSWGEVLTCNANGVPHAIGDFIVSADNNGMPNLQDKWVVNGEIFPSTYDMRAFSSLNIGGGNTLETKRPTTQVVPRGSRGPSNIQRNR